MREGGLAPPTMPSLGGDVAPQVPVAAGEPVSLPSAPGPLTPGSLGPPGLQGIQAAFRIQGRWMLWGAGGLAKQEEVPEGSQALQTQLLAGPR